MRAFNLFAYLSRSDVTWNPSVVSVCKDSLYCPTTEEYILPVIHGNDRVEWFVQLSDEIQLGRRGPRHRRAAGPVIMKAGDVAAMPADIRHQGYSPKRSMLLVWENGSPELPELIARAARCRRRTRSTSEPDACRCSDWRSSHADKLFIGGEFVDARRRRARIEVLEPARLLDARRGRRGPRRPTSTGRSPRPSAAFPAWSRTAAAERGRLLLKLADAIEANAEELARLESTRHRPPDARLAAGSTCRAPPPASATSAAWPTSSQGDVIPVEPGFLNYVHARAGRRGRPDRAVELPADVHQLEDGPGAGRRQHRRDEAGRDHAAVDAAHRRADGRGRLPAGRRQHRARATATPPAQRLAEHPDVAQDRLHRLDRDRPPDRARPRPATSSGAARARRQGRQHRVRRRRPRRRGQRLGLRHLPQPGPGLHRRLAADPARDDRRRVPRPLPRAGPLDPARQPARPGDRDGPADLAAAPRPRAGVRQGRASTRAARSSPAARRPTTPTLAKGCYVEPTVVRAQTRRPRVARRRCSARSSP